MAIKKFFNAEIANNKALEHKKRIDIHLFSLNF